MMDDAPEFLDQETRDRLVLIIETALHVRNAAGFFLWTQGAVQTLLPHEILLCLVDYRPGRGGHARWFSSSRYFKEEHFRLVCDPQDGLVSGMVANWMQSGRPEFLVEGKMDEEMARRLTNLELKNLIGQGVRGVDAKSAGYFCFARTPLKATPRTAHLMNILLPWIYVTWCRVLAEESRGNDHAPRSAAAITPRETEILHWIKDGKTTSDIAEGLGLSPFTVRNHVKNIFKKLGAKSRSHAVAEAMSLGILRHRA